MRREQILRRPGRRAVSTLIAAVLAIGAVGCAADVVGSLGPTTTTGPTGPTASTGSTSETPRTSTGVTTDSTETTTTAGTTVVTPSDPPEVDRSPETVLAMLTGTDAGVDGVRSVSTTVLFGDGRMVRPGDGLTGREQLRLSAAAVDRIMQAAGDGNLLTARDFGEPGISDQGWLTLTLDTPGGTVEHRVYAPSWTDGLSDDQVAARAELDAFIAELVGFPNSEIVDPPSPIEPTALQIEARPLAGNSDYLADAVDWPFPDSARDLFGANGCATVTGKVMDTVIDLLPAAASDMGYTDAYGGRSLVVETGIDRPAALALMVRFPDSTDPGAAARSCPADRSEPEGQLVEPFPGSDRRAADSWAVWTVQASLAALSESGELGRDASGSSDLTWYDYAYSMATVVDGNGDSRDVVDVVASASYSERDPMGFSVRVDRETGAVLETVVDEA